MANDFVIVAPDSTGKKVQTQLNTINGQPVEAQCIVPVDRNGLSLDGAPGAAVVASALLMGGSDGTNLRYLSVDTTGKILLAAQGATGATTPASALLAGASDGTNLRGLLVESASAFNLRSGIWQGTSQATVTAFHNADNQTLPGGSFGLLGGGIAQLLNANNALDRQRETGSDNASAVGIASGTQQLKSPISTTLNATPSPNPGASTLTLTATKFTNRGTQAWIRVGSVLTLEYGTVNEEKVVVTAVNYGTNVVTIAPVTAFSHANGAAVAAGAYNEARDATTPDGSTGLGFAAGATYLLNGALNGGAGGWEGERSASGELDGASGAGTAVAVEYLFNSGGGGTVAAPAGTNNYDRNRNLTGKGLGSGAISSGGGAASTSVTLSAAPTGLQPGSPVYFLVGAAGTAVQEVQYTTLAYVAGTNPILLQSGLVLGHGTNAVAWDSYAPAGPGLNGFMPSGIGIEEEAVFDPVSNAYYVERAATQDAMPAPNIVAEAECLWNGSNFDRARSAVSDALATTGIAAEAAMIWNGASFDRLKEATADALTAVGVPSENPALWNGTAFDRGRSGSAANLSGQQSVGAELTVQPGNWSVVSTPAAATQASAVKAAGGAGVRHVCTSISASFGGTAANAAVLVNLLDGATIVWSQYLLAIANDIRSINISGLNIVGTAATSMTLQFASAGAAGTLESVTITGYDAV